MNVRRSIGWASACVLTLALAAPALAAERNYWRYHGGHFENTTGNRWEERAEDKTFHFVETDRTERYVQLFDKDRDITVRLYDDRQDDRTGHGDFHEIHKGGWGKD